MLNEEELKAAMSLEEKAIISFRVNPDGTLDVNEKSYDISAINDYILLLRANEKASMERGYELGKKEGYYRGDKEATENLYGERYFMGDETQVAVRITRYGIDVYERVSGINISMQPVEYTAFLELGDA